MGTAGIFVGHGFYTWFSLETIGRIREKNRHHGRGTEVPGPWNKQVRQRPAVIPRGDEAAEGNEPKRSPRKISRRERLVPEPGLMPESEAPRRNGVRQAERPTRTEKAMQLRVRRDMGWPPAEKRATAATSSSRRLITTGTLSPWFAAVKKSFAERVASLQLQASCQVPETGRRQFFPDFLSGGVCPLWVGGCLGCSQKRGVGATAPLRAAACCLLCGVPSIPFERVSEEPHHGLP